MGKTGRYTQTEGSNIGGLCVSPVSGHAVIVLKGKRNQKESISLIHYSKYTPTHTLNAERNSFDKNEELKVFVYFNHLTTNPQLIEVLHVRLQESSIAHELREIPEKQKGIISTYESTATFNSDSDEVKIVSHENEKAIKKYYLLNEQFRLLNGLVQVGKLTVEGKIEHVPHSKYIKYNKDIYRHVSELATKLVDPIEATGVIFDNEFKEADKHDVGASTFITELISDITTEKCTSIDAVATQLNRILTSRCQMSSPRELPTQDHPFFGNDLKIAAQMLISSSIITLNE